jgi:16S rRNA (cytidine1402-2'-O)-methyltransferase
MSALALSGIDVERFYFYGFLSAKKEERQHELRSLQRFPYPIVFLDAPYRLLQVLEDMKNILGKYRRACVACDLTLPNEDIQRGTLGDLVSHFTAHKKKCEFVIIVESEKKK